MQVISPFVPSRFRRSGGGRHRTLWTLGAFLLACACAAEPAIAAKPLVQRGAGRESGALQRALDSVRAENIRADIFFIASDSLGGRDTPSDGLEIAARYIRSRLERLGWQPGAEDGYFYKYPLRQRRIDEDASILTIDRDGESEVLHFGRDYFIPAVFDVSEQTTSGGVVYCGKGREQDFEAANAAGSWALCLDSGLEVHTLSRAAKKAGVLGLIVAPGPDYTGESYNERFEKVLARQRRGAVSYPSSDKFESREVFPVVMLGRDGLAHLFRDGDGGRSAASLPPVGTKLDATFTEARKLIGNGMIQVENVCALWPGSDPSLSKEAILVTAHYDHVGTRDGVVYNGADDNGSGTTGLLAVAEALTHYGPMRRSVMLMWVSGEEKGLWGSRAWTEKPWLPEGMRAVADINIDMVGRNAPDQLLVTPTRARSGDYNAVVRLAESLCASEGFPRLLSADDYYTRSDHYNFAKLGIPVAFLFSDVHEDYHEPGDDAEKVDCDKVRRVMRLVIRMLDKLQADPLAR